MKFIGIDIKGKEAIIVTLEKQGEEIKDITGDFKKIKLSDDYDWKEINEFQDILFSHLRIIEPERIGIIKCTRSSGPQASGQKFKASTGATAFKIESIIQLYKEKEIEMISWQKVNNFIKSNDIVSKEKFVYQKRAYNLALLLIQGS